MLLLSIFLSVPALSATPSAQAPPTSNSLKRAVAAFELADADHDGKIGLDEARAIPVAVDAFAAQDDDKDAAWSRDEFLMFYRRQLDAAKQKPAPDLEAEIARIGALKRVKAVEETKKLTTESSPRSCDAHSAERRLEQALADLQARAAERKATREDVQRLRNLVIVSGRAASSAPGKSEGKPQVASSQAAMLEALERIEKQTALGQYTASDFDALRAGAAERAKYAADVPPRSPNDPQRVSTPVASSSGAAANTTSGATGGSGPAESRRRAAPAKPEPQGSASKPQASPRPLPRPAPKPAPSDRPPTSTSDKDKTSRP